MHAYFRYAGAMNAWTYLIVGILFETAGTTSLKLSDGFTNVIPSLLCVVFFVISLYLVSLSVRSIEISVAYAVWSGVGVVLLTFVGALYFHESITATKLMFIALIVAGVVGLQLTDGHGRIATEESVNVDTAE